MKRLPFLLAALVSVSACATTLPPSGPAVAPSLASADVQDRLSSGRNETMVRTYLPNTERPGTLGTEIAGAECTLVSDELRATVTTPQAVVLPTFKQRGSLPNRGVPGAIAVNCDLNGRTGQALVTAEEKELAVVSGAGIGGLVLGLAVSAATASATPWSYPSAISVNLGPQ